MRFVWLTLLVACGPGLARPSKVAVELSGDPADIESLLRVTATNGGLWFDDATCAAEFGTAGEVAPASFPAFAKCLAGLQLQRSAREDALGDVVVYSYAPGFEVEARITNELSGPRLAWIGFAARSRASEPPTITVDAFEALRARGDRNGPLDPALAAKLALDPTPNSHSEFAWLKVCIDEAGAVNTVVPYASTSGNASVAFAAAAKTWAFRPFLMQGQPMPVCAMVRPAYPAGGAPPTETLPLPLPPQSRSGETPLVLVGGVTAVEGKRIRGQRMVTPDDATKTEIGKRRGIRVVGRFRVCISTEGTVESVLPIQSTGFASYDRRLLAAMNDWVYSPYTVNGTAVPVCTQIIFIYTQR